ncbi:LUD domain-containing protein [Lutibacter sp.]
MSFLKNLFSNPKDKKPEEPVLNLESLSLDQLFVKNFLKNNGKFLYCTTLEEVTLNLANIMQENSWKTIICNDYDLLKLTKTIPINIVETSLNSFPFLVSCEHLIAENGSILFSSNQLKECKISELTENFIVYATTSQLVKTNGDGLTGIKSRYQGNIPSNISAIKNYSPNSKNIDFMNYGNTNAKNLYLLLFEDL